MFFEKENLKKNSMQSLLLNERNKRRLEEAQVMEDLDDYDLTVIANGKLQRVNTSFFLKKQEYEKYF